MVEDPTNQGKVGLFYVSHMLSLALAWTNRSSKDTLKRFSHILVPGHPDVPLFQSQYVIHIGRFNLDSLPKHICGERVSLDASGILP